MLIVAFLASGLASALLLSISVSESGSVEKEGCQ